MLALITASLIFGSLVALAALVCGTILLLAKSREEGAQRSTEREETRILREIYQGLEQMENRLESLEVIIGENNSAYAQKKEGQTHTTQKGERYE